MNERLDTKVPRRLDEMPRLLLFDVHQVMIMLLMLGMGIVGGFLLAGTLAGFAMSYAYAHFKKGRHPMFLMHLAYWYLPPQVIRLRRTPPSHLRLFAG